MSAVRAFGRRGWAIFTAPAISAALAGCAAGSTAIEDPQWVCNAGKAAVIRCPDLAAASGLHSSASPGVFPPAAVELEVS